MDKEKGVQHKHRNRHKLSVTWRRSVYGASLRVGNAAVSGTHIIQCVYQVGDKGSLSSVSEHDADWGMCAFLARLLPVCKPVSRLTSAVRRARIQPVP